MYFINDVKLMRLYVCVFLPFECVRAHARKGERRADLRQVRVSFVQGDMTENTTLLCFGAEDYGMKLGS